MINNNEKCQLILGDCLEKLKEFPNETFDLVLTDPPYALKFMGKQWDSEFPKTEVWKEILRTMKSGAFCVFTMSPRQDCLLNCLQTLKEAGFNLGFSSCYWIYNSGFPKSLDIAKMIDTKFGLKRKIVKETKSGGFKRMMITNTEQGFRPKDYYPEGNKFFSNEPISEQAKQWQGWKSCQLKPAVECIIVVQKPRSEKTIIEQVLKNGCGAVNIEAGRIPFANEQERKETTWIGRRGFGNSENDYGNGLAPEYFEGEKNGRFPANLFVSGNPLKGEETTSGIRNPNEKPILPIEKGWNQNVMIDKTIRGYSDSGSPNRFYDLDRWAEKRGITLAETPEKDLTAFFDVPKPATSEKDEGLEELQEKNVRKEDGSWNSLEIFSNQYTESSNNPTDRTKSPKLKNFHPTTKPVLLFSYLAELFCQPKGLILDPFMGSGTTGIAALKQNKRFVGIEKEPEYFEIAKQKIETEAKQTKLF